MVEIVRCAIKVGCPPTGLPGGTDLIDLSVVKIRPSPEGALEHEHQVIGLNISFSVT